MRVEPRHSSTNESGPHCYQGVDISGAYWTETGDEETLKKLVAKHGAVSTGVAAAGAFSQYKVQSALSSLSTPEISERERGAFHFEWAT